jgi:hypothetical protein
MAMKKVLVVVGLMLAGAVGAFGKAKEPARVRVAHFSPDGPAAEVMVDGTVEFGDLKFQTITPYKEVKTGKVHIQVVRLDKKDQVPASVTVKLKGEKAYTVVINGLAKNQDVSVMVLTDELRADKDKTKVRFVQLSAEPPKGEVLDGEGKMVFKNVEFRKPTGYEKLAAGNYSLELVEKVKKDKKAKKEAAKDDTAAPKGGAVFKDLKFEAGKNYTVFAIAGIKEKSLTPVYVVDGEDEVKEGTATQEATKDNAGETSDKPTETKAAQ